MKYILAIDQGTTGSRAIIFDEKGKVVASSHHEFPQYFPYPGWVEHDPGEIWESVNRSIQKVLKKVSPAMIAAIGITNQRETTVLWDKETGKPVYNAIVWQCRRTAERCDQIKRQKGRVEFFRKITGLPVDAYFSGTKVEWILNNVPAARTLAKQGRLLFGNTDAWVLWKLTGGKSHATDYTNASRTMLFNIDKKIWDKEILGFFKIPLTILPKVQSSSSNFGTTVKIGNLPAGIPITGMAGDQQAALFGQTCFEPGTMKNTYGTGCFVLLNSGKKRPKSKHGLITTLGCDGEAKPVYVLEGSIFIAGAAIQWLRDGLQIIKKASDSEKMSTSLKDNAGVYFVPAFVGLGAPYWDQAARGTITGLTRGVEREHLVRAATEAMCYSTRDIITIMEKDSKLKIKYLKVDGGAVRDNFLCQFQADILGKAVIRPKVTELTALGAAFLAGLYIKLWKSASEIKNFWAVDKVFKPHLSKKVADFYYSGWQTAIVKTLSHR
jgi:glycerol kinase